MLIKRTFFLSQDSGSPSHFRSQGATEERTPADDSKDFSTPDDVSADGALNSFFGELDTTGDVEETKKPAESAKEEPKTPVEASKPETKVEAAKEPEKPVESKATEPEKPEEIDDDLKKELEAIKLRPNTPEKIKGQVAQIKAIAERERREAKAAKARIAEYEGKVKELETIPKVDENLQKELKELKDFRARFEFDDERQLNEQFDQAKTQAADNIYGLLAKNGLPENDLEAIKKQGLHRFSPGWWKTNIIDRIANADPARNYQGDPFAARELEEAVLKWMRVDQEREAKRGEYIANRENIYKEREQNAEKWWQDKGADIEKSVLALTKDLEWTKEKQVPAGATPEKKAEIEKFNADLNQKKQEFGNFVNAILGYDSKAIAEAAFGHFHSQQLLAEKGGLEKQLADANARIKALEEEGAKRNQAGRTTRRESVAETKPLKRDAHDGNGQISAEQAFDAYFEK